METLLLIGGGIVGVVALIGLLITKLTAAAKQAGRDEVIKREAVEADKAKTRADVVLGEHREPSAVDDRLRRGDF